jgi:hypothetical protein
MGTPNKHREVKFSHLSGANLVNFFPSFKINRSYSTFGVIFIHLISFYH